VTHRSWPTSSPFHVRRKPEEWGTVRTLAISRNDQFHLLGAVNRAITHRSQAPARRFMLASADAEWGLPLGLCRF
jgi:hypothetical protein